MAFDRHLKLEQSIRAAYRAYWRNKLTSARQQPLLLPAFDVPRAGGVDLFLGVQGGTTLGLVLRSDFVVAYKHAVGQLVGVLAHYHRMSERELRDAVQACSAHPEQAELNAEGVDVLKVAKLLQADRKAGQVSLLLATDLPEIPQQARELEASFFPVAQLIKNCLTTPIQRKRLCQAVDFLGVNLVGASPTVAPLSEALRPLLKAPI